MSAVSWLDGEVTVRRFATAIATAWVAFCVALAVPVSQLRLRTVIITCCCPDPAHCHCPDHHPDSSDDPSMRACHRSQHDLASLDAPAFTAPLIPAPAPPLALAYAQRPALDSPTPSPDPAPPYGPS
jgi:hypothetical protein